MEGFKAMTTAPAIPKYFQLLVSAEAGYPPGAEPGVVCKYCGAEMKPDWKAKDKAWDTLTPAAMASLSRGLDLFRLPSGGSVYVSDRMKNAIELLGATNVSFRAYPAPPTKEKKQRSKLR